MRGYIFYPDLTKKHITRIYWHCGFSNQPCHILSKENGPRRKMYDWRSFVDSMVQKTGHLFQHFFLREQKFSVSKGGIRWVVKKCTVIELIKTVNGEIAFALINLFHVQIQDPASRSITRRAFIFLAKFISKNIWNKKCMTI